MGYYSSYELTVQKGEYNTKDILKEIVEMEIYPFEYEAESMIESSKSCNSLEMYNGECKWYEHEKDMINLSKSFPEVVFKLHGEGEESDDIWDKYFKNGKMRGCYAEINIEPYSDAFFEI